SSPYSVQSTSSLHSGCLSVNTILVDSTPTTIPRAPHDEHVRPSCRAIFRPQSGHQISSSLRAMKIDCQTPKCFFGLQASHSVTLSLTGLNPQAASSLHRQSYSAISSQPLYYS